MDLRTRVIYTEQEFPRIFSNVIEKDYGLLFYNTNNPDSYDSNHAILYADRISELVVVLKDIIDFYLRQGLVPRIYNIGCEQYFRENQLVFESCGFQVSFDGMNQYTQLTAENNLPPGNKLSLKLMKEWDERIATDIYHPDGDTYTPIVIKNSIKDINNYTLVGYDGDKAVSTASIYHSPYGVVRLDNVETVSGERGKGYCREVISAVVDYYKENFSDPFIIWAANDTAARIYETAGFRNLFELEVGEAVYI